MIGLWYAIRAGMTSDRQYLLPAPDAVVNAFFDDYRTFAEAASATAGGAAIGFLAAVAVATGMALLLTLSPLIRASLYPYLMILQMTPVIVFAPIQQWTSGPALAQRPFLPR